MAKKIQNEQTDEETKAEKAQAVAETVNKQVEQDAKQTEEKAIQIGKDTELLEDQIWQEAQHDNPFEFVSQAQILEVKENKGGQKWVKFQAYQKERTDRKEDIGYVTEADFRARFVKQIK